MAFVKQRCSCAVAPVPKEVLAFVGRVFREYTLCCEQRYMHLPVRSLHLGDKDT